MTMQGGDGSWDPIIDMALTKKIGMLKLNAYASDTFSTEKDIIYRWGNTFQCDSVLSTVSCNPAPGVPNIIFRNFNGPQLSEDYRIIPKAAFVFYISFPAGQREGSNPLI